MVGLPVTVVGIKSIDSDTGNRADLLYRKAWSVEGLLPNWFRPKVSLELVERFGVLYLRPRCEFQNECA